MAFHAIRDSTTGWSELYPAPSNIAELRSSTWRVPGIRPPMPIFLCDDVDLMSSPRRADFVVFERLPSHLEPGELTPIGDYGRTALFVDFELNCLVG